MTSYLKFIPSLIILTFFFSTQGDLHSQSNTQESLEVSILTCGQGQDLYTLFGHSALRLRDTITGRDMVYNWGTFDYGEPGIAGILNFGFKFLRGKLPYRLTPYSYDLFQQEYSHEGRSVKQQVLDLNSEQKASLLNALVINLQKENRTYKYDFYFDNCVTRPRDILEKVYGGLTFPGLEQEEKTFRDLLHENLRSAPWTEFGMDLILGTQNDDIADTRGQMFLPQYYHDYMAGAKSNGENIVTQQKDLLPQVAEASALGITPSIVFWFLLILEIIGAFLFYISGDQGFLKWYDRLWFFALSISALIMTVMWIGTEHTVCENNYNLLWAGPWVLLYWCKGRPQNFSIWLTLVSSVMVLLCWRMIPQALPSIVILICLISILKTIRRLGYFRKMDKMVLKFATVLLVSAISVTSYAQKIDGITLVAPPREFAKDPMPPIADVHADWIALVPYGFSRHGEPQVIFGSNGQWWGEKREGIEKSIEYARANNLKVMIKPQVWIHGTWVGDVDYTTDEDWKIWEDTYRVYIMQFVELAVKHDVEMICVGTEYRQSVKKREAFWRSLISEIREVYNGKLTYSANWDDYDNVPFWDALDYVGISAYFPLSDMDTPPKMLLSYRWGKNVKKLRKYSEKVGRKILFTEYGYLSVDGAAGKTWELEKKMDELPVNEKAQANGYDALLDSFWDEDFWAGGFLWKWFPDGYGREGRLAKEYTPRDKKAADILSKWYSKSGK